MSKVVVFGTGSFGELANFYFTRDSDFQVVAFTASAGHLAGTEFCGKPLVPFEEIERHYPPSDYQMFIAVGYRQVNRLRAARYTDARAKGYTLASYISSRCTNWAERIGDNCFVFEDNTLQPFVTIGDNVILWSGNHVGHHTSIGDHCFLTSHVVVSGHCTVRESCFLGVNATIRDGVTIGEGCVIGAGALIMKSTSPRQVYLGERTKPFAKSSDEIGL